MPRAVEITFETGVIVYDALFVALADDMETVVVTAEERLLRALEGTPLARRARYLSEVSSSL